MKLRPVEEIVGLIIHEAGHALACLLLNVPFDLVRLDPPSGTRTAMSRPTIEQRDALVVARGDEDQEGFRVRLIQVFQAGRLAMDVLGKPGDRGDAEDREWEEKLLRLRPDLDGNEIESETRALLSAEKEALHRLAAFLQTNIRSRRPADTSAEEIRSFL